MTSSYPSLTANRMVLDTDGSTIFTRIGTVLTLLEPPDVVTLNNESSDALGPSTDIEQYIVAFPELRDVGALYLGFSQAVSTDYIDVLVEGSGDTTNGVDGTWSTVYASNRVDDGTTTGWWGHTAAGDYRRYIRPTASAVGVRALRIVVTPQTPGTTTWSLVSLHVFGGISAGQNPHRLALWHPTENRRVPGGWFDWGDAPLSSSADIQFRVRNLSPDRVAGGIVVSKSVLTDSTPSFPPRLLLSAGGGSFTNTVNIGSLNPSAVSRLLTIRRTTPSDAEAGPWAARIRAAATTWTEVIPA